jgi:hypothetical protein
MMIYPSTYLMIKQYFEKIQDINTALSTFHQEEKNKMKKEQV